MEDLEHFIQEDIELKESMISDVTVAPLFEEGNSFSDVESFFKGVLEISVKEKSGKEQLEFIQK